jgi:hypothetical protein
LTEDLGTLASPAFRRRLALAFWVIRLDEIEDEHWQGARFISRFTKDRNSYTEQAPIELRLTSVNGTVEIKTQPASGMDIFRQWIEDDLTERRISPTRWV